MKTIQADFNAMTEAGDVRLTTLGAKADLQEQQVHPPSWAWLTDQELVVGARLKDDPRYGIVGEPDWETLVHLDEDPQMDFRRIGLELEKNLLSSPQSEDVAHVFELLTQFEFAAPPELEARRGYLSLRRASILLAMGKLQLSLLEIETARTQRPNYPIQDYFYLHLLRQISPDRAEAEARRFADNEQASAIVLAAAINILADHAESRGGDRSEIESVLRLCDRLEHAPGRPDISASLLSLVYFNRGMMLLALGDSLRGRETLDFAHRVEPTEQEIIKLTLLIDPTGSGVVGPSRAALDDPRVREIAAHIRSRPRSAA